MTVLTKKAVKVTATVEFLIDEDDIFDLATLQTDLQGELVKVKSGAYENMFYGDLTTVVVSDNSEEITIEVFGDLDEVTP